MDGNELDDDCDGQTDEPPPEEYDDDGDGYAEIDGDFDDGEGCPLASGYCCYIAINSALSECCWLDGCPGGFWTTDISGTGFGCAPDQISDTGAYGSSTGWLTTSWSIEPGESFDLTFHIHDTSDQIMDSEVLLDNFQWHTSTVLLGTEPAS